MSASTVLPSRAALRDILSDLLGRPITVAEGTPHVLDPDAPGVAGVYRSDDGAVVVVSIACNELVLAAGAALEMAPEHETFDAARSQEVLESFPEVLNVLARVLNNPMRPRVALAEVVSVPGPVGPDVAAVVTAPTARFDYEVTVRGYGVGALTLISSR